MLKFLLLYLLESRMTEQHSESFAVLYCKGHVLYFLQPEAYLFYFCCERAFTNAKSRNFLK